MFFIVKNEQNLPIDVLTFEVARKAYFIITYYEFGADEISLTEYLLNNYKLDLRAACLKILHNCTITNVGSECRVVFKDRKLDALATLITFGVNGKCGSNILKTAFA